MSNAEWDGVGLPPVHANIEWIGKRGGYWVKSRVVDYTSTQVCLLHHSDQKYKPAEMEVFNISNINIRPIKSERDKAIDEMQSHMEKIGYMLSKHCYADLYDAGYRKVEQ